MAEETNQEAQEISQEQIKELRDMQIKFMKDQLPGLKIQEEYCKLKAQIAEHIYNEQKFKMGLAHLKAPQPQAPTEELESKE